MMSAREVVFFLLGAGCTAAPIAHAHHSWSNDYDLSRSTVISGTVARFVYQNPHSSIVIDVLDPNGKRERWTAGWGSPQRLRERGIHAQWLRAGDPVYVIGNPHRNEKTRALRVQSLQRLDAAAERD
jgi:hypothetical protein